MYFIFQIWSKGCAFKQMDILINTDTGWKKQKTERSRKRRARRNK